jgi:hypothetical protein
MFRRWIVALGAVSKPADCKGLVKREPGLRLSARFLNPSELA